MSHRHLESLDQALKDDINNNLIFGLKLYIPGGEFRQILPVARRTEMPILVS